MFRRTFDFVFSVGIVLLVGWFLWEARGWPFYSRLFPWSIGGGVLLLALAQLGVSVRATQSQGDFGRGTDAKSAVDESIGDKKRLVTICGWVVGYLAGIWLLGFRVGSLVLTIGFLKAAAGENSKVTPILGAVNYLFFLLLFDFALGVPLFEGIVPDWLGIESLDGYIVKAILRLR